MRPHATCDQQLESDVLRNGSGRRAFLRTAGAAVAAASLISTAGAADSTGGGAAWSLASGADNFYKSDKVTMQAVTFPTQYRMQIAGNIFVPKSMAAGARLPAIVVGHPMGAVKEQSSNLYAQKLAEQGFVTLSLDLPFWGGSDGQPRNAVSPDLYAEAFSAAVDFLDTQATVDSKRIGVLGICGRAASSSAPPRSTRA